MLSLPVRFFSDKSSGALSQSFGYLTLLPEILTEVLFSVGLTAAMSALYIVQVGLMAPALSVPALITFILEAALILICMKQKSRLIQEQLEAGQLSHGLVFALFSGIQKIKLSGSENRVFAKWAGLYQRKVRASYRYPFPAFMQNEMVIVIQMLGLAIAFLSAKTANVSVAQYAAFSSAFGMVMAALSQLSASSEQVGLPGTTWANSGSRSISRQWNTRGSLLRAAGYFWRKKTVAAKSCEIRMDGETL